MDVVLIRGKNRLRRSKRKRTKEKSSQNQVYEFKFNKSNVRGLSPNCIPLDIWKLITSCLSSFELKRLRNTCRGFLFLVSLIWKPIIKLQYINAHFFQLYPNWPMRINELVCGLPPAEVNFYNFDKIKDCKGIESLKRLIIYDTRFLRYYFILHLQSVNTLEYIKMQGCQINNMSDRYRFRNIAMNTRKLVIKRPINFKDSDFDIGFTRLTSLSIKDVGSLTGKFIQYLPTTLIELKFKNLNGRQTVFDPKYLSDLPKNLRKLSFSDWRGIAGNGSLPDSLTCLELYDVTFDTILLNRLPSSLTKLTLSSERVVTYFDDHNFSWLRNCNLRSLELRFHGMTDRTAFYLPSSLERLVFNNTSEFTDCLMATLPTRLRCLSFIHCEDLANHHLLSIRIPLRHLRIGETPDLDWSGFNDNFITSLKKLSIQNDIYQKYYFERLNLKEICTNLTVLNLFSDENFVYQKTQQLINELKIINPLLVINIKKKEWISIYDDRYII